MNKSLYTSLVSGILFPIQEKLKQHTTVAVRRDMENTQWYSASEIQKLQFERLRHFLVEVEKSVSYYRELFSKHSINPSRFSSIADLEQIPMLTKVDIRAHTDDMKAENSIGLARFNTGGSSGEPLIFYIGKERVSHDVAAKWRATRWWNVDIGDTEIVVWGSPIELGAQDRIRSIRDAILRTSLLPAFAMNEIKLEEFIDTIVKLKPKMLFGYPSALAHIATYAEGKGHKLDQLGVRVAFVTSEKLYDEQRTIISRVFGCPVANGYGGRDAGFIAHECPAGSMHITAEDIIVEIVDNEGKVLPSGESGEIVVTHLATRDFPFIRYRTGDVGILGDKQCSCGRGLPILKEVQGRTTDFVVGQDGTIMHGLSVIYILRDLPGIKQFKIVQETLVKTTIYVVTDESYASDNDLRIISGIKARLGEEVKVVIEKVEEIPAEKSGKFRYVVSHVKR